MPELKMPHVNVVIVSGRLVADPHALTGKDETPGASFTIANNRWVQGKVVATTYVDCVCWGDTATAVRGSCMKGSPVIVTGALASYERKVGKEARKVLQVSAQSVQFLAKAAPPDTPPA